jgi:hypothetical protein
MADLREQIRKAFESVREQMGADKVNYGEDTYFEQLNPVWERVMTSGQPETGTLLAALEGKDLQIWGIAFTKEDLESVTKDFPDLAVGTVTILPGHISVNITKLRFRPEQVHNFTVGGLKVELADGVGLADFGQIAASIENNFGEIIKTVPGLQKLGTIHLRIVKEKYMKEAEPLLDAAAWVDTQESKSGRFTAYILSEYANIDRDTLKTIAHELVHCVKNYESGGYVMDQIQKIHMKVGMGPSADVRIRLHRFFTDIEMEGLARYIENIMEYGIRIMDDEGVGNASLLLEHRAEIATRFFLEAIAEDKIDEERYRELQMTTYTIGSVMIEIVRKAFPELTIDVIFEMGPFELVKKYEQACEQLGQEIKFSALSGKGMFDYKGLVEMWATRAGLLEKVT